MAVAETRPPASDIASIRRRLWASSEPIAKGKEILLDEYGKNLSSGNPEGAGIGRFEASRSLVLQSLHEILHGSKEGKSFLDSGALEAEEADAKEQHWYYLQNGMEYLIRSGSDGGEMSDVDRIRILLDEEANGHQRFLLARRSWLPGMGYAISLRKRDGMNQDSFVLGDGGLMAIADGCSSQRFSSIASHIVLSELCGAASSVGKGTICRISDAVKRLLNDQRMIQLTGNDLGGGCSTLLAAARGGEGSRVFKVGDSLALRFDATAEPPPVSFLGDISVMRSAMGQMAPLRNGDVEEYDAGRETLILTSDGITNYLDDPLGFFRKLLSLTMDPVLVAEKTIRTVLQNQTLWGHSDDATIIVQAPAAR